MPLGTLAVGDCTLQSSLPFALARVLELEGAALCSHETADHCREGADWKREMAEEPTTAAATDSELDAALPTELHDRDLDLDIVSQRDRIEVGQRVAQVRGETWGGHERPPLETGLPVRDSVVGPIVGATPK